jgi:hypothetical protein
MRIRPLTAVLVFGGALLVAACDGENLFSGPRGQTIGGSTSDDVKPPTVEINTPRGDSLSAKPIGDSVFVSVHVTDNVGVRSVKFFGIARRGNADLGTDTVVTRFQTKEVTLPDPRDTTLTRYILPTPDSIKETAQIVVEAQDSLGNLSTDTVALILGGPDVELLDVEDGGSVQSGLNLSARIRAQDPLGIIQIRLDVTGAFNASIVRNITPPSDSVVVDTVIAIPAGISGEIQVSATARNNLDVAGQDGPITLTVLAGSVGDTILPRLKHTTTAPVRMELQDSVSIVVTGADDSQGAGVAVVGYTVLGISPSRGETRIRTDSTVFTPARTGTVTGTFTSPVFNVDSLSLPDTLIFETVSWMRDAAGNCAASVGVDSLVALACGSAAGGEVVAQGRTGTRLTRSIVAGKTVLLPFGGTIMDAVVDTVRRNLLLSNITRDRIEVFRLQEERFVTAIPVGSEPWGMTLNNCAPLNPGAGCGDTLVVGNSGGTNLSNVYLGPTDGLGPAGEDAARRFLTPDVVLFDVEQALDDNGVLRYRVNVLPNPNATSFSDRPQFVARDSTGRVLYSTKVVEALDQVGTIRKAFVPPGALRPEVVLFLEHAALDDVADFWAVGHIDGMTIVNTAGDDQVILRDHTPGDITDTIFSAQDELGLAATDIAGKGSDVFRASSSRFNIENIGFTDTTFVAASGDGGWVVFGEGAIAPVGRVIMYEAAADVISSVIEVSDLITNAGETVQGLGLNYDGTQGVVRGSNQVSFFTTDLRLQGGPLLALDGGAGAVLHPLHANALSLTNLSGEYRPDTHLAFVGTGENTIDIYDTFHFFRSGRIFLRDVITGPLRASLPFPEDNIAADGTPFQCVTTTVTDQAGRVIGDAIQIFQGGDFNSPWPVDGGVGGSEDRCVVVKLYGTTSAGGVVVVDVRKSDILRDHPSRQNN